MGETIHHYMHLLYHEIQIQMRSVVKVKINSDENQKNKENKNSILKKQ